MNGLRAFATAGRTLNFRIAAEELGVTHGAVAQHIRALEADIGQQLFERLPRSLALTDAGRAYLVDVARAFELLSQATTEVRGDPGQVIINVTPSFATRWLMPNLQGLREAFPEVEIDILATRQMPDYRTTNFDLAIRDAAPPFGNGILGELLFRRTLVAVASPLLLERLGMPGTPDDLRRFTLLNDMENEWPSFIFKTFGTRQFPVAHNVRYNLATLAIDAAIDAQGLALSSRLYVKRELESGKLVEVFGASHDSEKDYYLLLPTRTRSRRATRLVKEWLLGRRDMADTDGARTVGQPKAPPTG